MLQVKNLTVSRGGVPILERVSFELASGCALVLRGPNGSGKTTLLRTIAGLQTSQTGEVITAEDSLAYAGHADGLKANLTVRENLQFWADIFGATDIQPALEQFDIVALSERPAHALSAGQKRRLGLARLILTGRSVWILDEPTVSLDAASTAMFAQAVQTHLGAGGSAILATHIDLGFDAEVLDVSVFKADVNAAHSAFDEGFL
ncbi:heme ABC exporter ATP-binding protein CcmA [Cognatishimia sp. WU-CL00825]|uniref:heme ABC exporter ATP-binding protein CcmA n=1 Tax=Cognatishimia sp. WU-CL00825 TaxID=3127658 RepID=UPI00310247A9